MQTVFFAAEAAALPLLAAAGGDPASLDLAAVAAGDLDPGQLLDLDTLMTGHDPAAVREAVLTPAGVVGRPGSLARGSEERVLLPVRPALRTSLLGRTDAELDRIAAEWERLSWGTDWDRAAYGGLLRSLAILAQLAVAEQHDIYVCFDV
jgi:hypothetical protein